MRSIPDHFNDQTGDESGGQHEDKDDDVFQSRQMRHQRGDPGGGGVGSVLRPLRVNRAADDDDAGRRIQLRRRGWRSERLPADPPQSRGEKS